MKFLTKDTDNKKALNSTKRESSAFDYIYTKIKTYSEIISYQTTGCNRYCFADILPFRHLKAILHNSSARCR